MSPYNVRHSPSPWAIDRRAPMLRVMLSLLLLFAQQLAFTHDLSHWSAPAARTATAGDAHGPIQGDGDDGQCAQYLSFADLESGPGTDPFSLRLADAGPSTALSFSLSAPRTRTLCVFLSRAPPLA